jgi:predicted ATPase
VVATCRSDEIPLDERVADWLAHMRGSSRADEIRLSPLPRTEVAEQVCVLTGGPAPAPVIDALYARAEGNPFFNEQLVVCWAGLSWVQHSGPASVLAH